MRVEHIGWRDERVDKDLDAIAGAIGFIVSDLVTSHQYNKWVEKQAKAEKREKIGETEYWYDEETKRWYPRVDLPAGLTLGERMVFLRNIRLSGVENIEALKEEQGLKDRYRELLNEFSRKLLRVGDTEKLNKSMLYLQMTQGADLKTKIGIMEELLQFLGEEGGRKEARRGVERRDRVGGVIGGGQQEPLRSGTVKIGETKAEERRRAEERTRTKSALESRYTENIKRAFREAMERGEFKRELKEGETPEFRILFSPGGIEVIEEKRR